MKKNVIVLTFILILTMMLPSLASAGYEITQSNSSMHGTTLTKIYISRDKYKNMNKYTQMIINFATDKIIVAIKNEKIYWQGTINDYLKAMENMQKSSLNRIKAALKKMPKEQRDKIMQIHGIGLKPKPVHVSVQKTKESEKIAGYKATKYIVKNNNTPFEEVWIAKGVNITHEINLKKLQAFSGKMKKATMGRAQMGQVELSKPYINLFKHGYPVKRILNNNMTITVKSIKKVNIPDKQFAAPTDYKKVSRLQQLFMTRNTGI